MLQEWNAVGVSHLVLPVPDLVAAPNAQQITKALQFYADVCQNDKLHQSSSSRTIEHAENSDKQVEKNSSVYVHCKAGRTRSATIVACILMEVCICVNLKFIGKLL